MSENIITIDLSKEITQAEYCRRTGDTLPNLATKLKKMAVRDIPELGLRLIDIAAPSFDGIRIEAPPIRAYSITELSGLFGSLLAKFKTDEEAKDAKIQSLERVIEEMTHRLETLGDELDGQKGLTMQLDRDNQEKEEALSAQETYIEEIMRQHKAEIELLAISHGQALSEAGRRAEAALTDWKVSENKLFQADKNYQEAKAENEMLTQLRDALARENTLLKIALEKQLSEMGQAHERVISDLKIAAFSLEEKEKANGELKAELTKARAERESLQYQLLDLSKHVSQTGISEEFQLLKNEFLALFKTMQGQASPSLEPDTSWVDTTSSPKTQQRRPKTGGKKKGADL